MSPKLAPSEPLLPLRTAVVLLWAVLAAIGAAAVSHGTGCTPITVCGAALATVATSALGFNKAIGH
ncbi:hypothetical protein [Mycolicibacterium llatzerense]|uniref:hypothetical protein n=1 Tax=Mycolicibacterium llatzerense TaxID=280871 RepID=UPI0021B5A2D5|nr:hypothetical protein [Mycolicibacterium llatzerense]